MGFSSLITEFRPISNRIPEYHHLEEHLYWVGIILDRIIGSSDPDVLADQVSNLSSKKETVQFLGFHFLQTTLSLELGIMDDSVQC